MRASLSILTILVILLGGALAACGPKHRGEPHAPAIAVDSAAEAKGKRLFQKFCYQCHPNGAAGLGPALNNKPLPEPAVRTQIKKGVGAMPSFDELLKDDEVAAIATYVHALRKEPAAR